MLEIQPDGALQSDDFRAAGNYELLWTVYFPNGQVLECIDSVEVDAPLSAYEQLPVSLNLTLPEIIVTCTEGATLKEVPFLHLSEIDKYDQLQVMELNFGAASEFLGYNETSRSLLVDEIALS